MRARHRGRRRTHVRAKQSLADAVDCVSLATTCVMVDSCMLFCTCTPIMRSSSSTCCRCAPWKPVSVACTPPAPGSAAARAGRYSCRARRGMRQCQDACRQKDGIQFVAGWRRNKHLCCARSFSAGWCMHNRCCRAGPNRTGSPNGSSCCALQHSQTQKWVTACWPRAAAQPTLGCSACRATTCVQESASDSASRNTQSPLAAPARRPALLSGAPTLAEGASGDCKAKQLELGCWHATHTCTLAAPPAAVCSSTRAPHCTPLSWPPQSSAPARCRAQPFQCSSLLRIWSAACTLLVLPSRGTTALRWVRDRDQRRTNEVNQLQHHVWFAPLAWAWHLLLLCRAHAKDKALPQARWFMHMHFCYKLLLYIQPTVKHTSKRVDGVVDSGVPSMHSAAACQADTQRLRCLVHMRHTQPLPPGSPRSSRMQ
jgi:hypothetical protein